MKSANHDNDVKRQRTTGEAASSDTLDPIVSERAADDYLQGSWIHPKLLRDYLRWCRDEEAACSDEECQKCQMCIESEERFAWLRS